MYARSGRGTETGWKTRVLRASAVVVFIGLYIAFAAPVLMGPATAMAVFFVFVILHGVILTGFVLRRPAPARASARQPVLVLAIALVVTLPFDFMLAAFGTRDVGSLLLTISENELGTMVAVGIHGFLPEILLLAGLTGVLLWTAREVSGAVPLGRVTVLGFGLVALAFGPLSHYGYRHLVPNPAHALINHDLDSLTPDILEHPAKPKNLVLIYLESLERSFRETPVSEAAFAALAGLEDRALSFRNLRQAAGTGFTVGGIVASQCGVPVMPRGVLNITWRASYEAANRLDPEGFMGSVMCLGDVLSADGYDLSYINGSTLTVFSKGNFFRSHGFDTVKGFEDFPGWQTEPRRNVWGMDDDLLFERITQELQRLAGGTAPFVLSALTLGTHGPDGFPDQSCPVSAGAGGGMLAAIACTGAHIEALLDEIDRLGLTEDTLVVVLSDHLAFRNALDRDLKAINDARRDYAVVLGAGQAVNTRAGSKLDVYPTLLELLGYRLRSGKAGLGQSLVAPEPTFVEREGLEALDAAIVNNSVLQEHLWRPAPVR